MLVTALSPVIGYQNAAHIAEDAARQRHDASRGGTGLGQGHRGAVRLRSSNPLAMVGDGVAGA